MKSSRRRVLQTGLSVAVSGLFPSLLTGRSKSGYSLAELDQAIAQGKDLTGLTKHDLPTPALLLDLDLFEANLARMSRHAKSAGLNLRPHAKTHKCVEIARRQLNAGALGVCVATIREAEVMVAAGIRGLLLTSEMVGREKLKRLVRLTAKQPELMSVVDSVTQAEQLNDGAAVGKVKLNVMLDIDPGAHRTGIAAGAEAIKLAEQVMKLPHLKLRGIHSYSGGSAHVTGFEARRAHSHKVMTPALETFFQLKKQGLPVEIMSGGSTGTYNIDTDLAGMTELQVGSYVFMDIDYRRIGGKSGAVYDDFGPALTVLATVISQNQPGLATIDAGIKAFATDRKFGPEIKGITGVTYRFGGDEHGILELQNPSQAINLGDRLEFFVPHCDPNVNLYERLYCLRGEKVEALWPVARGFI